MKTVTVDEFKAHFTEVIEQVRNGEQIEVTSGNEKEVVGYFQPVVQEVKPERKLGLLEGKGKVIFMPDVKMTEEEFLGL